MTSTGFSLPATLSYSSLQRLLPELALADTAHFVAEPPGLVIHSEIGGASVAEQIGATLSRLGLSWQAQTVANMAQYDGLSPYQYADAVLTLIVPAGGDLPAELAPTLAEWNVELRGLRRLSTGESTQELALELYLDDWSRCAAHCEVLVELATRWEVDVTLAPSDSKRPRRRLFAFDMDSTLIQCEVIDELARRGGVGDEVAAVTARAMRGELDFRSSFRERMSKLRGLPASEIQAVAENLPLMPGARSLLRTLRSQGHYTVILSGGFDYFAKQVQRQIGMDEVHANQLQIVDDQLTGEVNGEIVDGERKVLLLTEIARREGFEPSDTVAVGDGANDLPMLATAGLGVAFHAKPLVRKTAPCAVSYSDLESLLYIVGVPRGGRLNIRPD